MHLSIHGHVVNGDGSTTEPMKSQYWIGDDNSRIAFDFLLLDSGDVALHSIYGNIEEHHSEVFLYEVVSKNTVEASAVNLVNDAIAFLISIGAKDLDYNVKGFVEAIQKRIIAE